MTEPILERGYWSRRIEIAKQKGVFHHSIFHCPTEKWQRIEEKHREILKRVLKPDDSILDAGCGYGRLLTLLPETWNGRYLGVDSSPEFISLAKDQHKDRDFLTASLLDLSSLPQESFGIAILISIRPMMIRNLGKETWNKMESEIRKVTNRILYLEYDENCGGFLE